MDYIDPVSEPALIIGSILYNPGYVTKKFMSLKNVNKIAKLDDVADVATKVDDVADASAKRAALRERIASGEIIRGTDDAIVIPEGRMAAPVADDVADAGQGFRIAEDGTIIRD